MNGFFAGKSFPWSFLQLHSKQAANLFSTSTKHPPKHSSTFNRDLLSLKTPSYSHKEACPAENKLNIRHTKFTTCHHTNTNNGNTLSPPLLSLSPSPKGPYLSILSIDLHYSTKYLLELNSYRCAHCTSPSISSPTFDKTPQL